MSTSSLSISVVLPVFNEEEIVLSSTQRILNYCKLAGWDFELIFVEDGCTDSTVDIINKLQSTEACIKLLRLPTRLGKGGSTKTAALHLARKEYMAYMDIDLAVDPSELTGLLDAIKNNDLVLGSRILRGNLPPVKRPFLRSFFSHQYSRLFRLLFRMPIHDPQCGFKIFRREVIPQLFNDISINGFAFDTELVVKAFCQGLRVEEVPINWTPGRSSKVSILREICSMGSDILSLWYYYHLLWKQSKATYPSKKGSFFAQLMFAILSLWLRQKQRLWISEIKVPEMAGVVSGMKRTAEITVAENELQKKELANDVTFNP